MSKDNNSLNNTKADERDTEQGNSIARLMILAGPRAEIPAELQARVYGKTLEAWRNNLQTPGRATRVLRFAMPLALAASFLLAVTFLMRPGPVDSLLVGVVARINVLPGTSALGMQTGDTVRTGDTLRTADGQLLSVALTDGTSLRLASNTSLQLDEKRSFTLLTGIIYADSGPTVSGTSPLEVRTGLGLVTDVGTQFLVSYRDAVLNIAVREGRVDVSDSRATYTAPAGHRMTLQATGEVSRGKISATDSAWDWVSEVAPAFDIQASSLFDFLTWVARETGKELIFTDNSSRNAAMVTFLSGSIRGFTPLEAVASVLPTTAFEYEINATSIVVGQ